MRFSIFQFDLFFTQIIQGSLTITQHSSVIPSGSQTNEMETQTDGSEPVSTIENILN